MSTINIPETFSQIAVREVPFVHEEVIDFPFGSPYVYAIRGFELIEGPNLSQTPDEASGDTINVELLRDGQVIYPEDDREYRTNTGNEFKIRISGTYKKMWNNDKIRYLPPGAETIFKNAVFDEETGEEIEPERDLTDEEFEAELENNPNLVRPILTNDFDEVPEGSDLVSISQDDREQISAYYRIKIRYRLSNDFATTLESEHVFFHFCDTNTEAFQIAVRKFVGQRVDQSGGYNPFTFTKGNTTKLIGSEHDATNIQIKTDRGFVNSGEADFARKFDVASVSEICKWSVIESERGNYDFSAIDELKTFTSKNNLRFFWYSLFDSYPDWFEGLSTQESKVAVDSFLKAISSRYENDIESINVLSDTFSQHNIENTDVYKNQLPNRKEHDWIVYLFNRVKKYFPNALLVMDDHNVITNEQVRKYLINVCNKLENLGLIDAIGVQANHTEIDDITTSKITKAFSEINDETTLPIHVTRFELSGDDETQLERYARVFPVVWKNKNVERVHIWGYVLNETHKHDAENAGVYGEIITKEGTLLQNVVYTGNFSTIQNEDHLVLAINDHGFETGDIIKIEQSAYDDLTNNFFEVETIGTDHFYIKYLQPYVSGEDFEDILDSNGNPLFIDALDYAMTANIPVDRRVIVKQFISADLNPATPALIWSRGTRSGTGFDDDTYWTAESYLTGTTQPVTLFSDGGERWGFSQIYMTTMIGATFQRSTQVFAGSHFRFPWNTMGGGPYFANSYWNNISPEGHYPIIRFHGASNYFDTDITVKKYPDGRSIANAEAITGLIDRGGDYLRPAYQFLKTYFDRGFFPETNTIPITDLLMGENSADIFVTEDETPISEEPIVVEPTLNLRFKSNFNSATNNYPDGIVNNLPTDFMAFRLSNVASLSITPWDTIPAEYEKVYSYNLKDGVSSHGPQIALYTDNSSYSNSPNTWQDFDDAVIDITYFVPGGHPAVGNYFWIGAANSADPEDSPNILDYKDFYSPKGEQIVGNKWSTIRLFAGTKHGGRPLSSTQRFLTITDQEYFSSTMNRVSHTGVTNDSDMTNAEAIEKMIFIAEYKIYTSIDPIV